jgi:hypothetical protein
VQSNVWFLLTRLMIFFSLIVFGGTEVPIVYIFPLPPLRGQPATKSHPRWQPISGQQSTVGWGDCWIRTQDCSFTIWCHYQWATTALCNEPPLLPPMSHHCSLDDRLMIVVVGIKIPGIHSRIRTEYFTGWTSNEQWIELNDNQITITCNRQLLTSINK